MKLNLNTHPVKVKWPDGTFTTYVPRKNKPIIRYERVPDDRAGDAHKLISMSIENLPFPIKGTKFIVNRDTIRATRAIARRLLKKNGFEGIAEIAENNPNNWHRIVREKYPKSIADEAIKYVNRFDLRAPGEQVRVGTKVDHCIGLLSEFDE